MTTAWRAPWTVALALGVGGSILAGPVHIWLHKALPDPRVMAFGFLAGGVPPLLLAPVWHDLPAFLRRPLDATVASIGVLLVGIGGIVQRGPLYALLRRDELVAATLSAAILSVAVAALVETHRRLAAVIASREQELAAERRAAVEAQLRALQAQIRPHFLFNTFNALSELIHEDPDAADELVTDLAHLLRYSLRSSADGEVPLGDELDAIARYLRIEGARLGDRLRVEVDVAEPLRTERVPGLILQPIVENAVQHAVASRTEGGHITIGARSEAGGLVLVVQDDGPGLPPEIAAGTASDVGTGGHGGGFANVQRRLALRFAGRARLSATAVEGGGTRIELHLPGATP